MNYRKIVALYTYGVLISIIIFPLLNTESKADNTANSDAPTVKINIDPFTIIYKYNEDPAKMINLYGLTIEPDPLTIEEDRDTLFTVSGNIELSATGQYSLSTSCMAYNSNSTYTNFTNRATIQIISGFDIQYYLGGTQEY